MDVGIENRNFQSHTVRTMSHRFGWIICYMYDL